MGIMVEYKEIWSLSPLHYGVSSYPELPFSRATVQEEIHFYLISITVIKLNCLTHLNLLLPLSHILSG